MEEEAKVERGLVVPGVQPKVDPMWLAVAAGDIHGEGRLFMPEPTDTPQADRFADFRHSNNIDDRREEGNSVKTKLREFFLGKESTYGAISSDELDKRLKRYSEDELSALWRSGGPSKLAEDAGFYDIGKRKP